MVNYNFYGSLTCNGLFIIYTYFGYSMGPSNIAYTFAFKNSSLIINFYSCSSSNTD